MASETVADIVLDMLAYDSGEIADVWMRRFADRIEAAHGREVAEKDGERKGILKANESLAADNTRLRGENEELRECLSDAVHTVCYDCDEQDENGCSACRMKCAVHKWRKALEGANDEGK